MEAQIINIYGALVPICTVTIFGFLVYILTR